MTRRVTDLLSSEFGRFLCIGAFVAAVDAVLFATLTVVGLAAAMSAIAGRVAGAALAFVLNRRFTFRSAGSVSRARSLARYWVLFMALTIVAMVLGSALVESRPAGVAHGVWFFAGWVAIEGGLFMISFLVQRSWVFATPRTPIAESVTEIGDVADPR